VSIHNNIELNKEKRVLLSPKKILSTKYLIFNDINNIEQLNDLKLIEDVQHDLKINKKDKNNDKDKANKVNNAKVSSIANEKKNFDDDNNNNNQRKRPTKILLVGYSYGSLLAASASANIPECVGVVSIAPPWSVKHWLLLFHSQHHLRQAQSRKELPKLFLIGDQDNFTSETVFLTTLETYFPSETTNTTGVVLPNVDHFFRRREKDVMKEIGTWLLKVFPKCQGDLKTLASGKVF